MHEIWLYLSSLLRKLGSYADNDNSNILYCKEVTAMSPWDLNREKFNWEVGYKYCKGVCLYF